jgi:hypothetical protein
MRTITYYLATGKQTTSQIIYPTPFAADDNTTQLVFDFTSCGVDSWEKFIDLKMSDLTTDIQTMGTGVITTFNLGSEHTKSGILKFNVYAKNGTDKLGFPVEKLMIENQLNNGTVTATVQTFITDYIDDRLTVKEVNTETLEPSSLAEVFISAEEDGMIFGFGIPKGDTGLTGNDGAKIITAGFDEDDMVFGLDDSSEVRITGAFTSLSGTDGTNGTDGISFLWKGAYSAGTTYVPNDVVSYNGSSYICILASTGNLPTDATYFSLVAQKGDNTTASAVTNTPAGNISAVTVQAAINELDTEKAVAFRLIRDFTLTSPATTTTISTDDSGNAFSVTELRIVIRSTGLSSADSSAANNWFRINGLSSSIYLSSVYNLSAQSPIFVARNQYSLGVCDIYLYDGKMYSISQNMSRSNNAAVTFSTLLCQTVNTEPITSITSLTFSTLDLPITTTTIKIYGR